MATHLSIFGWRRSHFLISLQRFSRNDACKALTTPAPLSSRSGVAPNSTGILCSWSWPLIPSISSGCFRQSDERTMRASVFCTIYLKARSACGQKSIPMRPAFASPSPNSGTLTPSTNIVRTSLPKSLRPWTGRRHPSISKKMIFVGSGTGGSGSGLIDSVRGTASASFVASGKSPYNEANKSSSLLRGCTGWDSSPLSPSAFRFLLPVLDVLASGPRSSATSAFGPDPKEAGSPVFHLTGWFGERRWLPRKVPCVLFKSTRNLRPSVSKRMAACTREANSPCSLRSTLSSLPIV
mmetsp:Transcript_68800/g.109157  ORF Transcript_68800/g.109157 Transcript_68800/m.109157 type:complete len:295 (+) Transcript_68800:373-1257(+)